VRAGAIVVVIFVINQTGGEVTRRSQAKAVPGCGRAPRVRFFRRPGCGNFWPRARRPQRSRR